MTSQNILLPENIFYIDGSLLNDILKMLWNALVAPFEFIKTIFNVIKVINVDEEYYQLPYSWQRIGMTVAVAAYLEGCENVKEILVSAEEGIPKVYVTLKNASAEEKLGFLERLSNLLWDLSESELDLLDIPVIVR